MRIDCRGKKCNKKDSCANHVIFDGIKYHDDDYSVTKVEKN